MSELTHHKAQVNILDCCLFIFTSKAGLVFSVKTLRMSLCCPSYLSVRTGVTFLCQYSRPLRQDVLRISSNLRGVIVKGSAFLFLIAQFTFQISACRPVILIGYSQISLIRPGKCRHSTAGASFHKLTN